ncbi:putative phage protein (TIGR02216 family) [Primorskyibacter sedentarius]|uniref:Putative phage protein (TIGR02216 family) n=1 Tax=Primorskyibacter sedentarius TaxID=745311 RepID=A0A4R3JEC4_9RHOB|nr:rcc01693 family protein [Primorskyibacter sedentarius]TCS63805.1 putative phage protein (TIGR02216 family) [Primorskyibacter sedentarius]
MSGLDWPALMRAGLQGLGLRPSEFWALTPAELRVMLGERASATALGRDGLEALIRACPDSHERAEDGRC